MHTMKLLSGLSLLLASSSAQCFDPSPAFPVPSWGQNGQSLASVLESIESKISTIVSKQAFNASSFSIELTSASNTIWSMHHTAAHRNENRPGTETVDENSVFRISAVTKVFTVLALLQEHQAGSLNLEDPISKHLPELTGEIAWANITLRALASHLSGIPREFAHSDLINSLEDPTSVGLPPATKDGCPTCDEYNHYLPCTAEDLLEAVRKLDPVFRPNDKSTYSNVAFELIGMAVEKSTGKDFGTYLQKEVIDRLGMKSTSMNPPSTDKRAVLPIWSKGDNYWGIDAGVQNATAGMYATSSDMSKLLQYILSNANQIVPGVNWLLPVSWATGFRTFYGMPWEILRTEKVLEARQRPVTFVTKSGGMPGYYSRITLMPEYGLGLTILVGGETELLSELQELITTRLIREGDPILWSELADAYDGRYLAKDSSLNSSLTISTTPTGGMRVTSFISNGTDALQKVFGREAHSERWHAQLIPTMRYKDESRRRGNIWRLIIVPERLDQSDLVWDDLCGTDVDTSRYAGIPANEFVFWHDEQAVELPAWKVKLERSRNDSNVDADALVVQGATRAHPDM
ncbi:unnamed protein product [Zymoseptoria tritici ST99CH_1A5]|nr:unnamed protein product [Zymoseptoria tritici ST99CH_1A5]